MLLPAGKDTSESVMYVSCCSFFSLLMLSLLPRLLVPGVNYLSIFLSKWQKGGELAPQSRAAEAARWLILSPLPFAGPVLSVSCCLLEGLMYSHSPFLGRLPFQSWLLTEAGIS